MFFKIMLILMLTLPVAFIGAVLLINIIRSVYNIKKRTKKDVYK